MNNLDIEFIDVFVDVINEFIGGKKYSWNW